MMVQHSRSLSVHFWVISRANQHARGSLEFRRHRGALPHQLSLETRPRGRCPGRVLNNCKVEAERCCRRRRKDGEGSRHANIVGVDANRSGSHRWARLVISASARLPAHHRARTFRVPYFPIARASANIGEITTMAASRRDQSTHAVRRSRVRRSAESWMPFAKSISYGLRAAFADAGLRSRGVHQHALRTGRHDRRSRHPLCLVDHGLPDSAPGASST